MKELGLLLFGLLGATFFGVVEASSIDVLNGFFVWRVQSKW